MCVSQRSSLTEAEKALDIFSDNWSEQYPHLEKSWRKNGDNLITIFDYPFEIRKILYTTNVIKSVETCHEYIFYRV